MAGETTITIVGNALADPELRFIPSGKAICNFRIASTPRILDKATNEWKDGEGLFLTVNCWGPLGENVAESVTKGMRLIVTGRLKQRTYETREGEKRNVFEIDADDVGPSVLRATAKVTKVGGQSGGGYSAPAQDRPMERSTGAVTSDPWSHGDGGMDSIPPF